MTEFHCLNCHNRLDAFLSHRPPSDPAEPRAGDIAICVVCGAVAKVNDRADGLRGLTAREWDALTADQGFLTGAGELVRDIRRQIRRAQNN